MSSSSLTHILPRIAELRPILPKPTASRPFHDSSSGIAHSHPNRNRHHHDSTFFSAYGRAYEYTHGSHYESGHGSRSHSQQCSKERELHRVTTILERLRGFCLAPLHWVVERLARAQHGSATASSFQNANAFDSCTNPASCLACLDYTVMTPPSGYRFVNIRLPTLAVHRRLAATGVRCSDVHLADILI